MAEVDNSRSSGSQTSESIWDALAQSVERFAQAWENAPPEPQIGDFLPPGETAHRRLTLVELIKVDLEYRWRDPATAWRIADYLQRWAELNQSGGVPPDLLYEEYIVRKGAGREVDLAEYDRQFPHAAGVLQRMVGGTHTLASTAVFAARAVKGFGAGETVDDFDLLIKLGRGAFATVFLARQRSMQRMVALKISADQGVEPQTLAQLDHPHIVRVYDQRLLPEQGIRLLYMQYVSGGTLRQAMDHVLQQPRDQWNGLAWYQAVCQSVAATGDEPLGQDAERPWRQMDWADVVGQVGCQLASALDYAHQRGVLHRDIKPANVLLSRECLAKLVDFNISFCSKLEGASPAAYFGGSLAYMSPEQLQACNPHDPRRPEELDRRSDIYSLGVLLFEMLTGRRPFDSAMIQSNWSLTLQEMVRVRQQAAAGLPWEDPAGRIPAALKATVERCVQPEPAERFQSPAELQQHLTWSTDHPLQAILYPPRRSWASVGWLATLLIIMAWTLLLNGLAAVFIYSYNLAEVVGADPHKLFFHTQRVINGVVFPLGTALIVIGFWPVLSAVYAALRGQPMSQDAYRRALARCARLGNWIAMICMFLWVVSGWVYPVALSVAERTMMPFRGWIDFGFSHALAGLAVGAYLFFAITLLSLRTWYPTLIRYGVRTGRQMSNRSLRTVSALSHFYQWTAASVPLVAIALLVTWGDARNKLALIVLCVISLIGFALVFSLARQLQRSLAVFARMTS